MADRKDYVTSLRRSKQRLLFWVEQLPDDMKLDAKICVNEFCDEAEREIEVAYWDGFKQHRMQALAPKPQTIG